MHFCGTFRFNLLKPLQEIYNVLTFQRQMGDFIMSQLLFSDEMLTIEESISIYALLVLVFVYFILFAFGMASYVLTALSLQTIAKRRQIPNAWLAWIPIADYWIIGRIADDYDRRNGMNRKWGTLLLIFSLISIVSVFVIFGFIIFFIIVAAANSSLYGTDIASSGMIITIILIYFILIAYILAITVLTCLCTICIFKIFESTVPEKAVKYLLLYILVPFAAPICLFKIRNKGYSNPEPLYRTNYLPQSDNSEGGEAQI